MKRSTISIVLAAVILAVGLVLIYLLVFRHLLAPALKPPAGQPVKPGQPALSDDRYAALDLYLLGPGSPSDKYQRVELTLKKALIRREDGKEYDLFDGQTSVVLQTNVAEKLLSEMIPAGPYGTLVLTFSPTALLVAPNGAGSPAFLPQTNLEVKLGKTVDRSRTIVAMFRLGFENAFGLKNSIPTYILPDSVPAEQEILGGVFQDARTEGTILDRAAPDFASVVKIDTGMDIAPNPPRVGTPGYVAPTGGTPSR